MTGKIKELLDVIRSSKTKRRKPGNVVTVL